MDLKIPELLNLSILSLYNLYYICRLRNLKIYFKL